MANNTIAKALLERGLGREDAEQYAALSMGRPGVAIRMAHDSEFRSETKVASSSLLSLVQAKLPERLRLAQDLLPKSEINKAQVLDKQLAAW